MTGKVKKQRIDWKGDWKQIGAEKFRGTKNGSRPACYEFKLLSADLQYEISQIKNLFEVILNTEEQVLVLTFWHPAYPGSSIEGYEYLAFEYNDNGDFTRGTSMFSFDNKITGQVKLKNTDWAKKRALELLNEF